MKTWTPKTWKPLKNGQCPDCYSFSCKGEKCHNCLHCADQHTVLGCTAWEGNKRNGNKTRAGQCACDEKVIG